jgi:hypothetical protein
MSYEVLTTIVVINAIVTFWLWRQVAIKTNRRPRLKEKAAKALWDSDPIVPRHDPPKAAGSGFSSLVCNADKVFFADFKEFANNVNTWLASWDCCFRLQELPDGIVRLNSDDAGPLPGRCFALYYNQTRLGKLEISPSYEYTSEAPGVHTEVRIEWARFLDFEELTQFLGAIARLVTKPQSDEYIAAQQSIQSALTQTLWGNYRISQYEDSDLAWGLEDWGELNVSFNGSAEHYMYRAARLRSRLNTSSS